MEISTPRQLLQHHKWKRQPYTGQRSGGKERKAEKKDYINNRVIDSQRDIRHIPAEGKESFTELFQTIDQKVLISSASNFSDWVEKIAGFVLNLFQLWPKNRSGDNNRQKQYYFL